MVQDHICTDVESVMCKWHYCSLTNEFINGTGRVCYVAKNESMPFCLSSLKGGTFAEKES